MRKFIFSIRSMFLLFLLFCVSAQQEEMSIAPMKRREQEGLYSVIRGFVGKWWNGSQLYPDPCGWTPIQGVSCDLIDGFWYVTVLNIGPILDNSFECTPNAEFSPHLFEFKHLKSLSLFNCFLHPTHPPITIPIGNWEKLSASLETLEFRSNSGLIGEIPVTFCRLVKLQSLVLMDNGLTGELPSSLCQLAGLKRLILAGNRFTGQIPSSLGGLNELLIFDLSSNFLSGSLPSSIGALSSLLKLDLSKNELDGKIPNEFGELKNLTLLDVRNNRFSGGLTESLDQMVSLEVMLLADNPIGGNLMGLDWWNLQNLIILDFSSMGLTGEIPESIADMRRLRYLALDNNHLSGNLTTKLEAMPSVNDVYLNGNNLTGELGFSEGFYGKMGRRLTVWSNPNLCYPVGLVGTNIPFGVKQCQQKVSDSYLDSKAKLGNGYTNQWSSFAASSAISDYVVDSSWWVFLVEMMILVLVNLVL